MWAAYGSTLLCQSTSAPISLAHWGLAPLSLFTLVAAAHEGKTARAALNDVLAELDKMGMLDVELSGEPQKLIPPRKLAAAEKRKAIRELKEAGLSQSEVCRQLGLPSSTFGRLLYVND